MVSNIVIGCDNNTSNNNGWGYKFTFILGMYYIGVNYYSCSFTVKKDWIMNCAVFYILRAPQQSVELNIYSFSLTYLSDYWTFHAKNLTKEKGIYRKIN